MAQTFLISFPDDLEQALNAQAKRLNKSRRGSCIASTIITINNLISVEFYTANRHILASTTNWLPQCRYS